jgi:hypothetical protein
MTTRLLKKLFVASVMAMPMAASVSPIAQARSAPVFTLVNRTRSPLVRFYASPSGSRNWEENILGSNTLRPGRQARITINDGRKTCIYDIRGDFADGDKVEDYKVNICTVGTYRFIER